jgi:hypothetical protein
VTIKGNPDRLEQYTTITLPTLPPTRTDAVLYGSITNALNNAPSSINVGVNDYSAWIEAELDLAMRVDERPAAFAFALRQLDHFVADLPRDRPYLLTNDLELFNALVAGRLAHPGETDANVYNDALNALTGTPAELAAKMESVITDITKSMNRDDVEAIQQQLRQWLDSMQQNNAYGNPPLTEEQIVQRAWVVLNARGDDHIVPEALVHQLQTLTNLLGRRRFDPTFSTAFYQSLGPQFSALLPQAISLASWSDNQRTSGKPTFDIQNTLVNVDSALAVASPNLDTSWRDELFRGAVHDGKLNDAFPLLFAYGHYASPFAQPAGQLGLNVLHGSVVVDRGLGSPGYPNFDHIATNWEDRGTILVEAAAGNPDAANALLRNRENAGWLTGNKFGRDGRHPPNWDLIAPSVRDLIVSGTVYEAGTSPWLARDAAVNVINASLDAQPGDASKALSPAYGQMVLTYLPDFARSPAMYLSAENRGDYISIGSMQAAQFTCLAMQDERSKAQIFTLRDALDLQTVVAGLGALTPTYPPWAQRLANIDGIVLSGDNGRVFVNARQQDANAKQYNQDIDMFQSMGMSVIGLAKFPGSALVDKVIEKGVNKLKDDYLYKDTNNAVHAGYTTNVATFSAFDHERLVVAEGQLIAAVHVEQSGTTLTADQAEFIRHAEQMLGRPYVESLRVAANGGPAGSVPVTARQLQEWAGNTPLDQGFTDASNFTDLALPHDGTSLWSH